MDEFFTRLHGLFELSWRNAVNALDIFLVSYLCYRILKLIRGTRAWRILGGVIAFIAVLLISKALQLNTLYYILDKATLMAPVALVILMLPELRQALEGFGKLGLIPQRLVGIDSRTEAHTIEEIVAAVSELASSHIGALIVIERNARLDTVVSSGVQIDARVTAPLLGAIFFGTNPLHDGAVVIRGDSIVAAACRLPLSDSTHLDPSMHMRHRAAFGLAEEFDSVVLVVSEERGTIGFVLEGRYRKVPSPIELRELLNRSLKTEETLKQRGLGFGMFRRRAKVNGDVDVQ